MHIAKILAGAAIIVAPFSIVTGQSSTQPDSGSHHRVKWLAGSGTAAGTALFLAITHSSNGGTTSNAFTPPGNPGADPNVPTGVTTPPADDPPSVITTPPPASDSTDDGITTPPSGVTNPPPADTIATTPPADSTETVVTPPQDDPPVVTQDPFDPPHDEAPPIFGESSTVPEPGSLALTATGIIGLIPLIRRRRK